jgi:hypothetical protein
MKSIDTTELTQITGGADDGGYDDGPRHPPPLPLHPPPGSGWPPGWDPNKKWQLPDGFPKRK